MMNQFVLATYENEYVNFRIERNQDEDNFFYLDHEGKETRNLENCISTEFKKNFPSEGELRFELLFRSVNQFYEKNGINFYIVKLESKMGYDLIKEIIKEKITYNIPFEENEKIIIKPMIIHINGFLFRNVRKISVDGSVLEIYSNDGILDDFISTEDIESFEVDEENIKIKYVGSNSIHHYDLFVSKTLNDLLNRFDSETDKPVLPKDKAVQWFKDVGYTLEVYRENDNLDFHYEGIFEVPCYSDDTCSDKLRRLYKLNDEVNNLLKHF